MHDLYNMIACNIVVHVLYMLRMHVLGPCTIHYSGHTCAGMFASLMKGQEEAVMHAFSDQIQQYHKQHDSNGDGVLDSVSMNFYRVNQIHWFCSMHACMCVCMSNQLFIYRRS